MISLNESTWLSAVASVKNSHLTTLLNLTHHFLLLTINGFMEKGRNILIQNKLRMENIKLQLLKIKKCPKLWLINSQVSEQCSFISFRSKFLLTQLE